MIKNVTHSTIKPEPIESPLNSQSETNSAIEEPTSQSELVGDKNNG